MYRPLQGVPLRPPLPTPDSLYTVTPKRFAPFQWCLSEEVEEVKLSLHLVLKKNIFISIFCISGKMPLKCSMLLPHWNARKDASIMYKSLLPGKRPCERGWSPGSFLSYQQLKPRLRVSDTVAMVTFLPQFDVLYDQYLTAALQHEVYLLYQKLLPLHNKETNIMAAVTFVLLTIVIMALAIVKTGITIQL